MKGAFRNEGGTPLSREKKLTPGWAADATARLLARKQRIRSVDQRAAERYQQERRKPYTYGAGVLGGKCVPRNIGSEINRLTGFSPRLKKPTTIVPETTAQLDAAIEGVIGEPDTEKGRRDWLKYKKESKYQKFIYPDD